MKHGAPEPPSDFAGRVVLLLFVGCGSSDDEGSTWDWSKSDAATEVQQDCGIWWCQSLPFKFEEKGSIAAGTTVTSQNCQ